MSGLFDGPGAVKLSAPKPPLAVPEVGEEVRDIAKKRRPRGREETVIVGALVPSEEELARKKKVLG